MLYVRYSSVKLLWKKVTHTSYPFIFKHLYVLCFLLMISSLIGLIVTSCPQLHLDVHLIIFIFLFYRLHIVFLFIYLSDFLFWIIASFFCILIDAGKAFWYNWTSIYDKSSPESGNRRNGPEHNIGHVWQTRNQHSQHWKIENIPSVMRKERQRSPLFGGCEVLNVASSFI